MSVTTVRRTAVAVALLLLGTAGCGARLHPVRGKVTYPDGKPLTEGTVVFESKDAVRPITARGTVQPDGSYELSTSQPGDGVPAGKYLVLVAPKFDPNGVDGPRKPPPFDPRFAAFQTSGLEFEVQPGVNDYPIQVMPPGKGSP
jgi:hypothetical protein